MGSVKNYSILKTWNGCEDQAENTLEERPETFTQSHRYCGTLTTRQALWRHSLPRSSSWPRPTSITECITMQWARSFRSLSLSTGCELHREAPGVYFPVAGTSPASHCGLSAPEEITVGAGRVQTSGSPTAARLPQVHLGCILLTAQVTYAL